MKRFLIIVLLSVGFFCTSFAQNEVIFSIVKTDGSTVNYEMNKDARIYYSDTQLMFYNGSETVSINFSEIRKAFFTAPQDVNEVENQQLSIYPNPAKDVLRINNLSDNQEVSIYSINGAIIKKVVVSGDSEINISDLRSGMYIVSAGNMFSKFIKM
ncbi:MAG: T9SS type A sorting domain-containing protein [Bacteroidales bacterium]|nr:T9SS type A sorting domain-containing protein [Bacteroidales bacterium]